MKLLNTQNKLDVETAYRKLKQWIYFDKANLFLRHRLAEFESGSDFTSRLERVADVIAGKPAATDNFETWLLNISCKIVPKSLQKPEECGENDSGRTPDSPKRIQNFITNLTSASEYTVERVNYFLDAPIEIYLIDILWLMRQGYLLDRELGRDCHGSRLAVEVGSTNDNSSNLFKKYHELYSQWRDTAIETARRLLVDDRRNVYLLGLDIQEYYYHIQLHYDGLAEQLKELGRRHEVKTADQPDAFRLMKHIFRIHATYRNFLKPLLERTHSTNLSLQESGIPIGLPSSPVLANWYLRDFDMGVQKLLRPAYYGRYLDDILLVLTSGEGSTFETVESFMRDTLVRSELVKQPPPGKSAPTRYEIDPPGNLYLRLDKCILQYFDASHSIAGLVKFKKQLEENASHFALLPIEERENSLEEVAYDLLYDGSVNKFRSVKGLAGNRHELAKYLARRSMAHLFSSDPFDMQSATELEQFFRGRNAVEFHMDWERVFAYYVAAKASMNVRKRFERLLASEIDRTRHSDEEISKMLRKYLHEHLKFSRSISEALEPVAAPTPPSDNTDNVWRQSNLIRHHLVAVPLLNYMAYYGSLVRPDTSRSVTLRESAAQYSPRFIRFDECMLFVLSEMDAKLQDTRSRADYQYHEFQRTAELYRALSHAKVDDAHYQPTPATPAVDDAGAHKTETHDATENESNAL